MRSKIKKESHFSHLGSSTLILVLILWLFYYIFIPLSHESVRRYRLDDPHTFYCGNYFEFRKIRTCLGVSNDSRFLWIFMEFLSTKFAACSKPSSRDIHLKPSYSYFIFVLCRSIQNNKQSFMDTHKYCTIK